MSRFIGKLTTHWTGEFEAGRAVFELDSPLSYEMGVACSGFRICVPAGERTDFASIPWFFWRILPPIGEYGPASVIHDKIYSDHMFSRPLADAVMYDAMTTLEVPKWKKLAVYAGLRIGGWWSYYGCAKRCLEYYRALKRKIKRWIS